MCGRVFGWVCGRDGVWASGSVVEWLGGELDHLRGEDVVRAVHFGALGLLLAC